jgi:hypothetical protein
LLSTARQNPEFALRVVRELRAPARDLFVANLTRPEPVAPAKRPGLVKCSRSPYSETNGLTAQLALFALGGRRR